MSVVLGAGCGEGKSLSGNKIVQNEDKEAMAERGCDNDEDTEPQVLGA